MIETSNALWSTSHTDFRNAKDTMGRVLVLLIILVTLKWSKIYDGWIARHLNAVPVQSIGTVALACACDRQFTRPKLHQGRNRMPCPIALDRCVYLSNLPSPIFSSFFSPTNAMELIPTFGRVSKLRGLCYNVLCCCCFCRWCFCHFCCLRHRRCYSQ